MQAVQRCLRTCRDEIKGIAILWVVLFHAQLGLDGLLYDIQKIGYGGVDLFFFLSGFGLYHSLSASQSAADYLRRRASRLLPAYLPFCIIWLMVMIPLSHQGAIGAVRTAVGNLFMVGFFSGAPVQINWYVSALMLSLLIAPFLFALIHPAVERRAPVLMAACFALGLAFIGSDYYMAAARLPVMIAGMAAAGWKRETPGTGLLCALAAGGFVTGLALLMLCFSRFPELLNDYGMYWHPFMLMAPAMCMGLGWLFSQCPRKLLAPLRMLGAASFEIFLFNAWIELLGKRYGLCSTAWEWLVWSVVSVLLGLLYHLAVKRAAMQISKKKQKRG